MSAHSTKMPKRPLGKTGMEVSVMGFGASPLGGIFREIDEDAGVKAVHEAFRLGINFFDTSPLYGATRSEIVLGRGLKGLPREQIYVTSKVGRYGEDAFDFSAERIKKSVRESLDRLQLTYLDLVHCHDIEFVKLDQIIEETLPALQELKEQGLIHNVGFSGLPLAIYPAILDRVPEGTVDAVLSYCHYSLNDSTLTDLIPYLKRKGVGIINASVLSMGLLTKYGPANWNPAPTDIRETCKKAVEYAAVKGVELPVLAIKSSVANPDISTHLIGCCTPEEVQKNVQTVLEAFGEQTAMETQVLKEVQKILEPIQGKTWPSGLPENN